MTKRSTPASASWISRILRKSLFTDKDLQPSHPFILSSKELKRLEALPFLTHTTTQTGGRTLRITDPFWFLHCYQELLVNEIYRFRSKSTTPLILDCGANIGLSIIYFKYLYPDAKIIGFEPDPIIFNALTLNTGAFELDNVTLYQKAVWSSETTAVFAPDGTVGGRLVDDGSTNSTIEVQTVRLRDWLETPVDMLKIDIEGAEYEVLSDCQDSLDNVDNLFVEYHGKLDEPQCLHEILVILERAGFRYHIKDANPVDHPFIKEERQRIYDLQSNVFAFRD